MADGFFMRLPFGCESEAFLLSERDGNRMDILFPIEVSEAAGAGGSWTVAATDERAAKIYADGLQWIDLTGVAVRP